MAENPFDDLDDSARPGAPSNPFDALGDDAGVRDRVAANPDLQSIMARFARSRVDDISATARMVPSPEAFATLDERTRGKAVQGELQAAEDVDQRAQSAVRDAQARGDSATYGAAVEAASDAGRRLAQARMLDEDNRSGIVRQATPQQQAALANAATAQQQRVAYLNEQIEQADSNPAFLPEGRRIEDVRAELQKEMQTLHKLQAGLDYGRQAAAVNDPNGLGELARAYSGAITGTIPQMLGGSIKQSGMSAGNAGLAGIGDVLAAYGKSNRADVPAQATGELAEIGKNGFTKDLKNYVAAKMGEGIGTSLPIVAAYMGGGAVAGVGGSAALGVGQMRGALEDAFAAEGVAFPEEHAARYVWMYGTFIGTLESMTEVMGMRALTGDAKRQVVRSIGQALARGVAKGAAMEGVTEALQEAVEMYGVADATGKPLDYAEMRRRMAEGFAAGAVPGAAFGGITGVTANKTAFDIALEKAKELGFGDKPNSDTEKPNSVSEAVPAATAAPAETEQVATETAAPVAVDPVAAEQTGTAVLDVVDSLIPDGVETDREMVAETAAVAGDALGIEMADPAEDIAAETAAAAVEAADQADTVTLDAYLADGGSLSRSAMPSLARRIGVTEADLPALLDKAVESGALRKTAGGMYRRAASAEQQAAPSEFRQVERERRALEAIDEALRFGRQILPKGVQVDVVDDLRAGGYELDALSETTTGNIKLAVYANDPTARLGHEGLHTLVTRGHVAPAELKLLAETARSSGVWTSDAEAAYRDAYSGRSGLDLLIDEEAAAHLVEARIRGGDFGQQANSIIDRIKKVLDRVRNALAGRGFKTADGVLDALLSGEMAQREARDEWTRSAVLEGRAATDPMLAIRQDQETGRSMREDIDALGYYSAALRAAKSWPQTKGTPEQALMWLKKSGVKEGEIEATGIGAALDGKKSVTRDEIIAHLENIRVGVNEVVRARDDNGAKIEGYVTERVAEWRAGQEEQATFDEVKNDDFWDSEHGVDQAVAFLKREGLSFDEDELFDDPAGVFKAAGVKVTVGEIPVWDDINGLWFVVEAPSGKAMLTSAYQSVPEVYTSKAEAISGLEAIARDAVNDLIRDVEHDVKANFRDDARMRFDGEDDTKWSKYSLDPGNPSYRETVLHLPSNRKPTGQPLDLSDGPQRAWEPEAAPDFRSGHFPEPNITGHMMTSMVKDAEGRPVYLIDQIQSDWGQKLRDGGVRDEAKIAELKRRATEAEQGYIATPSGANWLARVQQISKAAGLAEPSTYKDAYANLTAILNRRDHMQDTARSIHRASADDPTAADFRRLYAEAAAADAATHGHPLVNTTDQWVNTTLRRALMQAVEADAEFIAIPSGKTVESYNPQGDSEGNRIFYEQIVPKNLRNLLRKLDKQSPDPVRVDQLETPTQGMKGEGFIVFDVTPEVKRKIIADGQPLFSLRRAYHGTGRDLPLDAAGRLVIDASTFGERTGVPTEALFLSDNVALASSYGDPRYGGDRVYRAAVETDNFSTVDMAGYRWSDDDGARMVGEIAKAKAAGRSGLEFKNMSDAAMHGQRATQFAVWDQAALRSWNDVGDELPRYQPGMETGNDYLDAALDEVGFDLEKAVQYIERVRSMERGRRRRLDDWAERKYDAAIALARELMGGGERPSAKGRRWLFRLGDEADLRTRGDAARAVMESPEWLSSLGGDAGRDTSRVDGYMSDAWIRSRVYSTPDGDVTGFDDAVDWLLEDARRKVVGGVRSGRKVFVLLGMAGSGKSTIAKKISEVHGAVHIVADDAKLIIPEYDGGKNSGGVHEESSDLAKAMTAISQSSGENLIVEKVGSSDRSIGSITDDFAQAGYDVTLVHVEVPVEVAMERAVKRWRKTGRAVPMESYTSLDIAGVFDRVGAQENVHETARIRWDEATAGWVNEGTGASLGGVRFGAGAEALQRGMVRVDRDQGAIGRAPGQPASFGGTGQPPGEINPKQMLSRREAEPIAHTPRAMADWEEIGRALRDTVAMLPPDVKLRVEEKLVVGGRSDIDGYWHPRDRLVWVSLAADDPVRVARHEVVHALRQSGLLADAEFDLMYREAERLGLRAEYGIDRRYGDAYRQAYGDQGDAFVEALLREEVIAEMFGEARIGRRFGGDGAVDRIVEAVLRFLERMRNALDGLGFRDVRDVFEAIETGQAARRSLVDLPAALHDADKADSANLLYGLSDVARRFLPSRDEPLAGINSIVRDLAHDLGITVRQGLTTPAAKKAKRQARKAGTDISSYYDPATGVLRVTSMSDLTAVLTHAGEAIIQRYNAMKAPRDVMNPLERLIGRHSYGLLGTYRGKLFGQIDPKYSGTHLAPVLRETLTQYLQAWHNSNIATMNRARDPGGYAKAQRELTNAQRMVARYMGRRLTDAIALEQSNITSVWGLVQGKVDIAEIRDYVEIRFNQNSKLKPPPPPNPLDPETQRAAFGKWFTTYVTDRAAAEAHDPALFEAFEDLIDTTDPILSAKLDDATDSIAAYGKAEPVQIITSMISSPKRFGRIYEFFRDVDRDGLVPTLGHGMSMLYRGGWDDLHPWYQATQQLLETYRQNTGIRLDLKATENAYKLLRIGRHSGAWAGRELEDGIKARDSNAPEGPSLVKALQTALGSDRATALDMNQDGRYAKFNAYLIARRAVRLWDRFFDGTLQNPPVNASRETSVATIQTLEAEFPEFVAAADDVYEFQRNLLKLQRDAGIITPETFDALSQEPDYVPFLRDMSDKDQASNRALRGAQSIIRKIKGSDRNIIDPISMIAQKVYETRQIIATNDAKLAMLRLAEAAGPAGGYIAERLDAETSKAMRVSIRDALRSAADEAGVSRADAGALVELAHEMLGDQATGTLFSKSQINTSGQHITWVYENGIPVPIKLVDGDLGKMLMETLQTFGNETGNILIEMMAIPAAITRVTVTAHPSFMTRNGFVDGIMAWMYDARAMPWVTQVKGFVAAIKESASVQAYARSAGLIGGPATSALDKLRFDRDVEALVARGYQPKVWTSPLAWLKEMGRHPLRTVSLMSEASETGTRARLYELGYERAIKNGLNPREAAAEAAFYAHDYMDYSRRGATVAAWVKLVPFMNAALQGMDRYFRLLAAKGDFGSAWGPYLDYRMGRTETLDLTEREKSELAQSAHAWMVSTLFMGSISLALSVLFGDREDLDDVPQEIKATHWVIPVDGIYHLVPKEMPGLRERVKSLVDGESLRLPKGFDNAWFANLVERLVGDARKGNPRWFENYASDLSSILNPPMEPQAVKLFYEMKTGKEFFGNRDIIPKWKQERFPEMMWDEYTSEFAKWAGKKTDVAPYYIDHALKQLGTSWARDAMSLNVPGLPWYDPSKPDKALDDYFIARRFLWKIGKGSEAAGKVREIMGPGDPMQGVAGRLFAPYSRLDAAAETYKDYLKRRDPASGSDFLDRLRPPERAYAILDANAEGDNAKLKMLHPIHRADKVLSEVAGVQKEILGNLFESRKRKKNTGELIPLSPSEKRAAIDILTQYKMMEAHNALVVAGEVGYAQRGLFDTKAVLAELSAAVPDVGEEFAKRLKKAKVLPFKGVREQWPLVREALESPTLAAMSKEGNKRGVTAKIREFYSVARTAE